jgi:hypothetical protein
MKLRITVTLLSFLVSLFTGYSEITADGTWSLNSPVFINTMIPVKPLRSGMTVQEIMKALGQPTQTNANGLEYTNLGIYIFPARNEFKFIPPFAAKTQWGIGIGSKRDIVIQAYGTPTMAVFIKNGSELLDYDPLGLKFLLENDIVISVTSKTGNAMPANVPHDPFAMQDAANARMHQAYARAVAENPDVAKQSFDVNAVPDEFFENMKTTNTQITLVMTIGELKPDGMAISIVRGNRDDAPKPTNWVQFQEKIKVDLGAGDGERYIDVAVRWNSPHGTNSQSSGFGVAVEGSGKLDGAK